ncbi:hypothetical protein HCB37_04250 [Listeria booriae]|uniref:hypothetical protein n=1 Tax=Listeria booriae TaxID=1552123 RepID=UPI001627142B|nr:hypothetical protein [Listeria booriae]MBC2048236.1 hypothetical protein [Listeria booriae]MBC2263724.1 hypothetical protein [Listeria booriae]
MNDVFVIVQKGTERKFAGQRFQRGTVWSGGHVAKLSYSHFPCFKKSEDANGVIKGLPELEDPNDYYVRKASPKELRLLKKNNKKYRKYLRSLEVI